MAIKSKFVPVAPLFSAEAVKKQDTLKEKQVWTGRLLYLLSTPIANKDLQKIKSLESLSEEYPLEGVTLGDIIQLQQIVRAVNGDTKAYNAINKTLNSIKKNEDSSQENATDPLSKMVEMLYSATKEARKTEVLKEDSENMYGFENVIEVDVNENDTSSKVDGENNAGNSSK